MRKKWVGNGFLHSFAVVSKARANVSCLKSRPRLPCSGSGEISARRRGAVPARCLLSAVDPVSGPRADAARGSQLAAGSGRSIPACSRSHPKGHLHTLCQGQCRANSRGRHARTPYALPGGDRLQFTSGSGMPDLTREFREVDNGKLTSVNIGKHEPFDFLH